MKFLMITICGLLLFGLNAFSTEKGCLAGQYQVKAHRRNGYVKSDGTLVRSTIVKSHCKSFTRASEYLEVRFKNGFPPDWPHKKELPGSWSEEEKERIRDAIEQVPEVLFASEIAGIYRLIKSKDFPNPASSSNSVIVLYDSAFGNSRNLAEIITHELSHQNYLDLKEKERQDYRRATGWQLEMGLDRKFYWGGRKQGYIEDDGAISPEEDYANNLGHFLYNPDRLKKVTPEAYLWIKNRFGESFKLKERKK